MFHPSMVCSTRPFQQSWLICSLKNSAMPCFIRRSKVVVALAPSEEDGLVGGDKRGELGIDRQPPRLLVMEWAPKRPAKMTPP
jgi:hypothetical protein